MERGGCIIGLSFQKQRRNFPMIHEHILIMTKESRFLMTLQKMYHHQDLFTTQPHIITMTFAASCGIQKSNHINCFSRYLDNGILYLLLHVTVTVFFLTFIEVLEEKAAKNLLRFLHFECIFFANCTATTFEPNFILIAVSLFLSAQ